MKTVLVLHEEDPPRGKNVEEEPRGQQRDLRRLHNDFGQHDGSENVIGAGNAATTLPIVQIPG